MRHLLWLPMVLVGFFTLGSLMSMASRVGAGLDLTVFSSIEFVLLVLTECVLFGAWVVACEVAENREASEAQQAKTRNLMRELWSEGKDEVQAAYGAKSGMTPEQIAQQQEERKRKEEALAAKKSLEGPHMWLAVVVIALVLVVILGVNAV